MASELTDGECDICSEEGPLFRWYDRHGGTLAICEDCHGKSFAWLWDVHDLAERFVESGCRSGHGTGSPQRVCVQHNFGEPECAHARLIAALTPAAEATS